MAAIMGFAEGFAEAVQRRLRHFRQRGAGEIGMAHRQHPGLTISQLSQKTQISRAAVRRCLYTLAALGMVHSPAVG
jgi:predicted ArsR family transcriptional regulator